MHYKRWPRSIPPASFVAFFSLSIQQPLFIAFPDMVLCIAYAITFAFSTNTIYTYKTTRFSFDVIYYSSAKEQISMPGMERIQKIVYDQMLDKMDKIHIRYGRSLLQTVHTTYVSSLIILFYLVCDVKYHHLF